MTDSTGYGPLYWAPKQPRGEADEQALKRHVGTFELSYADMVRACVTDILDRHLGLGASARARTGVLGDGRPIPMMSYGFIEYVMGLDLSAFELLELGGGNSTLFWAERARSVLTLEHDRAWHDQLNEQIPSNVDLQFIGQAEYPARIAALDRGFDLIVIDCGANRFECARAIDGKLKPGGLVVLDNSEWYPNTAGVLREQGLIQVDFPDFRPDHWFRCCTSIFIHPEFRPQPREGRLPLPVLGGKDPASNSYDRPA